MLIPIIGWMLFGLIVGAIARALYPGRQSMGLLRTMLLGIVGSFIGGFAGYLLFGGDMLQASGWIGSILGAVVLIAIVYSTRRERIAG
ncbi:MAG: GlsB/YeaQ/YmgE family stress response membrane protein [Pirellulaceae bacterium]|nr:GlsB/YeaQ/YmgE family stress response membrane protein [Pirellulaceae bacterium]